MSLLYRIRLPLQAAASATGGGSGGGGGAGGGGTGGGGGGGSLPTVAATHADLVPQSTGVNVHAAAGGQYANNGPNYPALAGEYQGQRAVREAILGLGVRHVRDLVTGNSNANQVKLYNQTYAAGGVTVLMTVGKADGSAGTVANCIANVARFNAGVVDTLEGANEWNGGASGGGYSAGAGSPTGNGWETDDWNWQKQIWANRGSYSVNAGPLAKRQGYSTQVNTHTAGPYSGICNNGDTHQYPGGFPPSKWIDVVCTGEQQYVKPGAPVDMSETGFHNALHYTGTHMPTPENVAGIYADRLVLEHYREPRVRRVFFYELADGVRNDALDNSEAHFGLCAWDAQTDPSWRRKPAFLSVSRLLALCTDIGDHSTFTPAPLAMTVTGGDSSLRQVLLGKRDGSYLLCLWRDVSIWSPATAGGSAQTVTDQSVTVSLAVPSAVDLYQPSMQAGPISTSTGVTSATVALNSRVVVLHIT